MRFLLKCIFWLGGVFLLMPATTETPQDGLRPAQQTSAQTHETGNVAAAQTTSSNDVIGQWLQAGKTLQEISSFCTRNPALCEAGKASAQAAGSQALIRAKETFESLTDTSSANTPANLTVSQPTTSANLQSTQPAFPDKIPVPVPRPR